ncbi:MAG: 16S rRNA (guanine(527)-N(7))-methyltransferase RsmG [Treponema sp.]|nr:16S rRNA (guanine(527)-N(7))-methyltransferase RsmG [Treponema sp.]
MTDNAKQGFSELLRGGIDSLCENDDEIGKIMARGKDEIISLLQKFINEIEFFNPALKLVGTNDTKEIIIKHILDSIAPAGILSRLLSARKTPLGSASSDVVCKNKQIADIGSGAGLPGIPLAVMLPGNKFTLVERMGRRAGFLLNAIVVMSLSDITVEEKEADKIISKNGFDLITFRAFSPLEPKLLKTLLRIRAPDGVIAAYKGKREKTEAEMAQLIYLSGGGKIEYDIIPYSVPFLNEERCLLVIK